MNRTSYTRNGQQILQNRKHMADAADEVSAMMILNALRALEEQTAIAHPPPACDWRHREQDEYVCSCGRRWGVDEDDPHSAS